MNLDELRVDINAVDDELFELLQKRMKIVKEVGEYKKLHHLLINDSDREQLIKNKIKEQVSKENQEYVMSMYEHMFDLSKKEQENV